MFTPAEWTPIVKFIWYPTKWLIDILRGRKVIEATERLHHATEKANQHAAQKRLMKCVSAALKERARIGSAVAEFKSIAKQRDAADVGGASAHRAAVSKELDKLLEQSDLQVREAVALNDRSSDLLGASDVDIVQAATRVEKSVVALRIIREGIDRMMKVR